MTYVAVAAFAFFVGLYVGRLFPRDLPRTTGEVIDLTGVALNSQPVREIRARSPRDLGPGERFNPATGEVEYSAAFLDNDRALRLADELTDEARRRRMQ